MMTLFLAVYKDLGDYERREMLEQGAFGPSGLSRNLRRAIRK
jgi:hypothetical protein